jgi:predicted nucleic acid-binding protein
MITAIDTNVLLDILLPNPHFCDTSMQALEDSAAVGSLVICDLVYAELCGHFVAQDECDGFWGANEIRRKR